MGLVELAKSFVVRLERTSRGHVRPESEAVYQSIFTRDLAKLGIEDTFYPLGFAANYGLLYLVLRCITTFSLTQIVELGGGQTTYLFDALTRAGRTTAQITTIESDSFWATKLQPRVQHDIQLAGLRSGTNRFGPFTGYDFDTVELPSVIDLLMVDGPPGASLGGANARHAAAELCGRMNPDGYIVIIDDAERPGEAALVELMKERLPSSRVGSVVAAKKQIVLAGGNRLDAAFF